MLFCCTTFLDVSTNFFILQGDEVWPECCLQFISGEQFGNVERVNVARLGPGAVTDISVNMHSPMVHGIYQGQWRMKTDRGVYFGGEFYALTTTMCCVSF